MCVCVCVCVCVWKGWGEGAEGRRGDCVCVCVFVCVRETKREKRLYVCVCMRVLSVSVHSCVCCHHCPSLTKVSHKEPVDEVSVKLHIPLSCRLDVGWGYGLGVEAGRG